MTDLHYKNLPQSNCYIFESVWIENDRKKQQKFVFEYSSKGKIRLQKMGIVDAGLQFGTSENFMKRELKSGKWVSVEFTLDQARVAF